MSLPELTKSTIYEDQSAVLLARLVNADGDYITQSTISSIAYQVFDLGAAGAQSSTGTFVVASTVFNSLQTGMEWSRDDTGYNFKATVPASAFPTARRQYRVEVAFTPSSGDVFYAMFEIDVREVLSS